MKRNMKIEINEEQPLHEVVAELERLGFKRGCWWSNIGCVEVIEADADTLHLVDYGKCDIDNRFGDLTTLTELKGME